MGQRSHGAAAARRPATERPAPARAWLASSTLWQSGFRPFFLLAALVAALVVPVWVLVLESRLTLRSALGPLAWHIHEMLFGYTVAVIAGFLLTAARQWTGRPTASPVQLAGLAMLWVLGRVAIAFGNLLPVVVVAAIDVALLPLLAAVVARPIIAARSRRNLGFVPLLLVLAGCNAVFHLVAAGYVVRCGRAAVYVALDCVLVMIAVVGGRIIPLFSRNALRRAGAERAAGRIRQRNPLDLLAVASVVAVLAADGLSAVWPRGVAMAALAAGGLNLARLVGWGASSTLRDPLLWVLHAGYAWMGIGLLLRGVGPLFGLAASPATHMLTVGAIGVLTLGMMARVALGHTGRALRADGPTAIAFGLINGAVLLRSVAPLIAPRSSLLFIRLAGGAWTTAFAIYLWRFAAVLVRPRPDGKPG